MVAIQAYLLDVLKKRADQGHNRRLLAEWAGTPLVTASEPFDTVGYLRKMREEREQELVRRVTQDCQRHAVRCCLRGAGRAAGCAVAHR